MSLVKYNVFRILLTVYLLHRLMLILTQVPGALCVPDAGETPKYTARENGKSNKLKRRMHMARLQNNERRDDSSEQDHGAISARIRTHDTHDPTYLFEQLNNGGLIDKNELQRHNYITNEDATPEAFAELDRLIEIPAMDFTKTLKFQNALKIKTAQMLQEKKEQDQLCYWLNGTTNKGAIPTLIEVNDEPLDTVESRQQPLRDWDKERALKMAQRERQMEHFQSAAADRAFERLMNLQRERAEGANAIFKPMGTSEDNSRHSLTKNLNWNQQYTPKSKCNRPRPTATTCTPSTISTTISTTPEPSTCPTTEPPTSICLPDPTPTLSTKPPCTTPSQYPAPICAKPKGNRFCKKKKKTKKKSKRRKQQNRAALQRLLTIIQGMKQHAILILKNLNYIEQEVLSRAPETCPKSAKKTKSKCKANGKALEKHHHHSLNGDRGKPQERLDRPKQGKNFYFGIRPIGLKESEVDVAAARAEEHKLELKVLEELDKASAKKAQASSLVTYLRPYVRKGPRKMKMSEKARLTKHLQHGRSLAAPAKAAHLEPNIIKEGKLKVNSLSIVVGPKVGEKQPQMEMGVAAPPAAAIIVAAVQKPIIEQQAKTDADTEHKSFTNKKVPRTGRRFRGRNKTAKRRRKKKKQKVSATEFDLRPERLPVRNELNKDVERAGGTCRRPQRRHRNQQQLLNYLQQGVVNQLDML